MKVRRLALGSVSAATALSASARIIASGGVLVFAPALASFGVFAGNGASSYGQSVAKAQLSGAYAYRQVYNKLGRV